MFVHLAVHATFSDVGRATTGMLAEAVMKRPQLLNAVLRDALTVSLTKSVASGKPSGPPVTSSPQGDDQEKPVADKRGRYAAVLLTCASFGDQGGLDKTAREVLVVDWVVLAHHPAICTSFFFLVDGEVETNVIGYRCAVATVMGRTVSEGRYGPARGRERAYRSGDETRPRGVHDGPQGAFQVTYCDP